MTSQKEIVSDHHINKNNKMKQKTVTNVSEQFLFDLKEMLQATICGQRLYLCYVINDIIF